MDKAAKAVPITKGQPHQKASKGEILQMLLYMKVTGEQSGVSDLLSFCRGMNFVLPGAHECDDNVVATLARSFINPLHELLTEAKKCLDQHDEMYEKLVAAIKE